jgi:hypothetical protein
MEARKKLETGLLSKRQSCHSFQFADSLRRIEHLDGGHAHLARGLKVDAEYSAAVIILAASEAKNTAATPQATLPAQSNNNDRPSIIIVGVLGYGGGSGDPPDNSDEQRRGKPQGQQSYNTNSPYQILGVAALTDNQVAALAAEKRTSAGRP